VKRVTFSEQKRDYFKDQINKLKTNRKNKNIKRLLETHTRI